MALMSAASSIKSKYIEIFTPPPRSPVPCELLADPSFPLAALHDNYCTLVWSTPAAEESIIIMGM